MVKDKLIVPIERLDDIDRERLLNIIGRYDAITTQTKELESRKRELSQQMVDLLSANEVDGVDGGAVGKVQIVTNTNSRILRDRLLERGVAPDVIKYATKETTSQPFIHRSRGNGTEGD